MTYKIKHMHVQRLRNVIDVAFDFDDTIVKISGNNGAWKSTVIDAIFLAIVGKTYIGKWRSIENLITIWQQTSEIEVVLEWNGKKLKINRKITDKGNMSLEIRSSEGEKLQQKDLDMLLSEFTIDPLEFTRKTKKEQYDTIKMITWVDTTEIDEKILIQEEKTRQARAISTEYKKTLDNAWRPEKVERVSTEDLAKEQREILEHNNAVQRNKDRIYDTTQNIERWNQKMEELKEEMKRVEKLVEDETSILATLHDAQKVLWEGYDMHIINVKIENADEINKKANDRERYCTLQTEAQSKDFELQKNADALDALREEKKAMIKNAKMPIPGMEFSENDGVIIDGILFDQYSSAQQLKMACRIATSVNPTLKVIYIKDGSLLDEQSLKEMEQFWEEQGYQIFIERVWEEADTIIMREWEALA